jgi:CBS domain-containing protein
MRLVLGNGRQWALCKTHPSVPASEEGMKAGRVMTRDVATCVRSTQLDEVARLMVQHNVGALPVIDDERKRQVVGIVTDRDIVCRALASGRDASFLTASDCMTSHVYVAGEEDDIETCLATMEEHHVRRLPVIDDKRTCVGILTLTNLAKALPARIVGKAVKEISEPEAPSYLVPGKEPGTESERSMYGGQRPEFTAPSNLPLDIRDGLPSIAMDLYYSTYDGERRRLEATGEYADRAEELDKACCEAGVTAVKRSFVKVGDQWVAKPTRGKRRIEP